MAKPFTDSVDFVYQWVDDTNRISENLGDPVDAYTTDGNYTTHNAAFPSYLINQGTYVHDVNEASAVIRALNDLNARKVQRTGDIISGNFRVNQNMIVDLDLLVNGGDLISSSASFNLLNTTVATVNAFGAATAINIGATTGLTTINHSVTIAGGATQSFIINDGVTTKFSVDSNTGDTLVMGTLGVTGNTTLTGDLAVNGGDITSSAVTFNLLNQSTTLNAGTSATTISLGAGTGTTTVNHNLAVNGANLTTTQALFNLVNTNATTVYFAQAATSIIMGATTGSSTVRNDLAVNGTGITTTTGTFALLNTGATSINAFGAATAITIGAATGTTTINHTLVVKGGATQVFTINDGNFVEKFSVDTVNGNTLIQGTLGVTNAVTMSSTLNVTGALTVTGDTALNGTNLTSSAVAINVFNTPTVVAAFAAATSLNIGATTGTSTIRNATTVITGNLRVDSANITTNAAITANIFAGGTVATLNVGTSATAITLGAATGSTTINHSLIITGGAGQSFSINDGAANDVFTVDSTNGATYIQGSLNAGSISTLGNAVVGDIAVNGGDITSTQATFNLLNQPTTVNAFGAATTLNIAGTAAAQTVNIGVNSVVGSTYNIATSAMPNGNIKAINIGTGGLSGSMCNITIGSSAATLGAMTFHSVAYRFSKLNTDGVAYFSGTNGTMGSLSTATANKVLLSGANAAPIWSTAVFPVTVPINSLLFAKTLDTVEAMQFISSDSTVSFDYATPGKVDLKTTGVLPSSTVISGDLKVGANKNGTYSQTGTTTISVHIVAHGLTTGNWVYLSFTTGAGVNGAYQITFVGVDDFTVIGAANTTSGNVTAQLGGSGSLTKVLTIGSETIVPTTSLFVKSYDLNQITKLMEIQDSTGSTKFLIETSGKTTVTGDLYVQGNIVNTGSAGAVVTQGIVENPVVTTSTTETILLSLAVATYRSVEYQIQAVSGSNYWTSKILAIQDGTNVNYTEYGMAGIGTVPGTFVVDILAGNIVLKATSASATSTTYKVVATAILV